MRVIKGNLFDEQWSGAIKCVTTNGIVKANGQAVMGAGLAKAVAQRHPSIPAKLGSYIVKYGNRPFILGDGWVSYPTKHNWRDASDLELIIASAHMLVEMANKFSWDIVVMPKPGCGLGGLDWSVVQEAIKDIFDDRFIVLT